MNKKYVEVTLKDNGDVYNFPSVTKMYEKLGKEAVGITINSLWNALNRNNNKYENSKVKVEVKSTWKQVWK